MVIYHSGGHYYAHSNIVRVNDLEIAVCMNTDGNLLLSGEGSDTCTINGRTIQNHQASASIPKHIINDLHAAVQPHQTYKNLDDGLGIDPIRKEVRFISQKSAIRFKRLHPEWDVIKLGE